MKFHSSLIDFLENSLVKTQKNCIRRKLYIIKIYNLYLQVFSYLTFSEVQGKLMYTYIHTLHYILWIQS
jgi:hypothetical protein